MKRIIYIITALYLFTGYLYGQGTLSNPINVGTKSASFTYTDTKNTENYTNTYGEKYNDIVYMFTITKTMTITASHCGSEIFRTRISILDSNKVRIGLNESYYGAGECSNPYNALTKVRNLAPGTYYVVSEGYYGNGIITTNIEGYVAANTIDIGTKASSFSYTNTQNTKNLGDTYGNYANEIIYKFTINTTMTISINTCDSELYSTYIYLLDSQKNVIKQASFNDGDNCRSSFQASTKVRDLPPGIYYVIAEGEDSNGNITTSIKGDLPKIIDTGSKSSSFIYTNTQNTEDFPDIIGEKYGDIYYKLTITTPMNIVISNCGSEVYSSFLYVFDAEMKIIAQDTSPIISNKCLDSYQAYIRINSLPAGTYYIVSEAAKYAFPGNITTYIEGCIPKESPIDIGSKNSSFKYTDTQNTLAYNNDHGGSYNEIMYKFTLTTPMAIFISHCGSSVSDTNIKLLDVNKKIITTGKSYGSGFNDMSQSTLNIRNLAAGTYYIVSYTTFTDGNITTTIQGGTPTTIDVGTKTTAFTYTHTQNTENTTDTYGNPTNDVTYKFALTVPMTVTISHCGSSISGTIIRLMDDQNQIFFYEEYSLPAQCQQNVAHMEKKQLPPGTYYVISEGQYDNGNITTTIKGAVSKTIELGIKNSDFNYTDTQNTATTPDTYGHNTNEVFYRFTLTEPMAVSISTCGSTVNRTCVYLLNADKSQIAYNDYNYDDNSGCNANYGYIHKRRLSAGTYYVVVEGRSDNGFITTNIKTETAEPIDIGSKSSSFIYTDTRNTANYSNLYGNGYNEIFYKFTITQKMTVFLSNCSSTGLGSNIYLLDAAQNLIDEKSDKQSNCQSLWNASLTKVNLAPETYYVVSEGYYGEGDIKTTIEGFIPETIDIGSKSSSFTYTDTRNTEYYTNTYGKSTNDVTYKLTLTVPMTIAVSHCNSSVTPSNIYILNSERNKVEGGETNSKCPGYEYLRLSLPAGQYYIISEGLYSNGNITTTIEGTLPSAPINIGEKSWEFTYTDTKDTHNYTDTYGQPVNEVFYEFTLSVPMSVTLSHCGSSLSSTVLHLLDADRKPIEKNSYYTGKNRCPGTTHPYIHREELKAGTYYVVSEGLDRNGVITTTIEGSPVSSVIFDAGVHSSSFVYNNTKNTEEYLNKFGRETKEVMYEFSITVPMTVTLSHCGSEVSDTFIYLLNSNKQTINYNDDSYADGSCSNNKQAWLKVNNLSAGTYYVVSEGKYDNGFITTQITGMRETTTGIIPTLSTNSNYIVTLTPLIEINDASKLPVDLCIWNVQYYDGLGRPEENILIGNTPSQGDLISYQEYDQYGRPSNSWLPIAASNNKGEFMKLYDLNRKMDSSYPGETNPYAKITYESSPLNRVLEEYGPGKKWHEDAAAVKTSYLTNNNDYPCHLYKSTDSRDEINISKLGNYGDNQLYVTRKEDESGKNVTYEFMDKLGRVVLTRIMEDTSPLDTYYIYDSYGNLRAVLPPLASSELSADAGWQENNTYLQQYAYLYKYDERNRCIAKKLPGAEWVYYIYDKADRLIFTQDGEMRKTDEWLFSIPDVLSRTVLTGICKSFNGNSNFTNERFRNSIIKAVFTQNAPNGYNLYENDNIVIIDSPQILTINYYDNYDFLTLTGYSSLTYITPGNDEAEFNKWDAAVHQGMLTGIYTSEINEGNIVLRTALFYDSKARLIQSQSTNHIGGKDVEYISYNFIGQPLKRKLIHTGHTSVEQLYTYSYDHAGRLLDTKHKLNRDSEYIIAQNEYDELGRVKALKHGTSSDLKIEYKYNVRSWITNINNYHFKEDLNYNPNGDISSMKWTTGNRDRTYTFDYDNLSRLRMAKYSGYSKENYDTFYEYDAHGNILKLKRDGKITSSNYGKIDDLEMTYHGNQLVKVTDNGSRISLSESNDFKPSTNNITGNHYFYNKNGALEKDLHKNITNISYNSLNLPKELTINGNVNKYLYAADGTKLQVKQGSITRNYVGSIVYENSSLKRVLIDGGYIEGYNYYFFIQDHLGNTRVVVNQYGSNRQTTHYYPFGMSFAETSTYDQDKQPYLYNGKEFDRNRGLNLYDYGARSYDGATGRFTTMDRFAEKYYSISPYAYAANNPVNNLDINGDSIWYTRKENTITMHASVKIINKSGSNINMKRAAKDISDDIDKSFSGEFTYGGETYLLNTDIQIDVANSMKEVTNSDHLFVLQDADGKSARGAVNMIGGKVMNLASSDFANDNWFSNNISWNNTRTAVHEFGHAAGLLHDDVSNSNNLMKQSGQGTKIVPKQRSLLLERRSWINQGINSYRGQPYPFVHDSKTGIIYSAEHLLNFNKWSK